jgi:hypothetical protein
MKHYSSPSAFQLVVNITSPKVICAPGSGSVTDGIKARVGYNPYWKEPPYPKQKLVKKKKLTPEQLDDIQERRKSQKGTVCSNMQHWH